jgi:hypothetical protein
MSWYREPPLADGEKDTTTFGCVVGEIVARASGQKHKGRGRKDRLERTEQRAEGQAPRKQQDRSRPLPAWKSAALERLSVMVGEAMQETMRMVRASLTIIMESEDRLERIEITPKAWPFNKSRNKKKWVVASATLRFPATPKRAGQVRALLSQPKNPWGYTSAYRFTAIEEQTDAKGCFWVTAEIARGEWKTIRWPENAPTEKRVWCRLEQQCKAGEGVFEGRASEDDTVPKMILKALRKSLTIEEDQDDIRFSFMIPSNEGDVRVSGSFSREDLAWKTYFHACSIAPATTSLQRLLTTYLEPSRLAALPRALRDGVAQEVAQQL